MRPQEWQTLSAYIDNQLSFKEKAALEKRLEKDSELQKALEELRQTKALLRLLPNKRIPHNFTLSADMVATRSPAISRLFPVFSLSSALATVLLVVSIVFQWGIGVPQLRAQSEMAPAADMTTAYEMNAEEEAPPPIILWGEQNYSLEMATGKGGSGGGDGNEPAPLLMREAPETSAIPPEEGPAVAEGPIEEQLTAPVTEMPEPEKTIPGDEAMEDVPAEAESLPAEEGAPQMMEPSPPEPLTGKQYGEGPILGLPSEEEAGRIILPAEDIEQPQPQSRRVPERLPILQILLGGLALASGTAAFLIHRKNQS